MRVKQIWDYVPLPAKLKLFADRITFSKLTLFYFAFSVIHCILQVALQVQSFKVNLDGARFLSDIISKGNATESGFTVYGGQDLRLCDTVPNTVDASSCHVVWRNDDSAASTGIQNIVEAPGDYSSSSPTNIVTSTVSLGSSVHPTSTVVASPASASLSSSATALSSASVSSARTSSSSQSVATSKVKSTVTVTVSPDASQFKDAIVFTTVAATRTVTVTSKTPDAAVTSVAVAADDRRDSVPQGADSTRDKRDDDDIPEVSVALASNGSSHVKIDDLPGIGQVTLSDSCLVALNWPVARVDNTKREDLVFIGYSVWVLGMSLVAVLNESPPHIVATFLTHMLATAWSGYQLWNTNQFHDNFSTLITDGACGVNLLPEYWVQRARFEIPTLALNAVALVISAILSWKLMKSFGWQTFKRIGASLDMSRAYRIILVFSIVIQLSAFFIVAAVALWIDQIYNGDIARLTTESKTFRAIDITILILMLPWLTIGWISVRREYRIPVLVFLGMALLYLAGWAAMFASATFRWTFVEWRFFSLLASASVVLTLIAFILAILCRLNFGKGLPKYLKSEEPLPGDDFVPATLNYGASEKEVDEEKVAFPPYDTPVPTYSAAYGDDALVPPQPAHVPLGARVLGPRFFAGSNGDPGAAPITLPLAAVDPRMQRARGHLARQGSGSSQHSDSSAAWSESSETPSMKGRRWVIE